MIDSLKEFYNFKIKIDTRSDDAKEVARKILKYIADWKFVCDENEIIRLDITPEVNFKDIKITGKSITVEGCFASYFVDFDGTDLKSLGWEIEGLDNDSYLSFYTVNNDCKHHLFGNIREKVQKYKKTDELFYLPEVICYEVIANKDFLKRVSKQDKNIEFRNEKEEEFCNDLQKYEMFEDPWTDDDFKGIFKLSSCEIYKDSSPEYDDRFGCIGFSQYLCRQISNDFSDIKEIIPQIKAAKKAFDDFEKKMPFRFDLRFTQPAFNYVKRINDLSEEIDLANDPRYNVGVRFISEAKRAELVREKEMLERIISQNNMDLDGRYAYLLSMDRHKILRIDAEAETIEAVTYL